MNLNIHVYKLISLMVLLLSAFTNQVATPSSLPQTDSPLTPIAETTSRISLIQDARQTESTTTKDKVGLILGSLLILSLYAFPMSFAESWAFGDPKKESSELTAITDPHIKSTQENGEEAAASIDDWPTVSKLLPQWVQRIPQVTAGLAAGGCLMVAVVIVGAVAFALYYLITGQPEMVRQIIPRFAYWFPFALLGMLTDIPFQIIYWQDRRLRVLLRLVIWWFPRLIIIAFVINPPILQGLNPTATALTVFAIDCVLAAFCLGLYTTREQLRANRSQ